MPNLMYMVGSRNGWLLAAFGIVLVGVNGHRTFRDCGLLKFPSLAADMAPVVSHIGVRFAVLLVVVRAVSAERLD